ncbi:DcaP family trimeric outer membrane transporter [Pyxidicoccus xibeiensis]|uniref:DcaP family trimeric outer membrane transporter n=1 Tax=Pyxidicoccus xibeiensis TaxID=2906759 RepID=UPI0020A7C49F|nr:DcaP family trimeric outer membrane transporter [Pyxidicoccus xibeiensis]MCP3142693.1 DcaP family trimeric outer membrane transporter [Pyxidicoccus xibeiensis]
MGRASQVAMLWALVLASSRALAFPMPQPPDAGTPADAEPARAEAAPDGGVPSMAQEATESEEPEPPTTEAKPEEVPGALIDPDLTGIVMKAGPATEEDLKRGYVTFRGRIKVDLNYDFRPIENEEDFVPASIPVGSSLRGPNLNFNAKQSRLFFEGGKLSMLGPLIGHVSADFYGEGSSGGDFRVYEVYAAVGPFLAGRKWSTFMGLESIPDTLDFQGPGSMLAARREMLRYGPTLGPLLVQVSLERPQPDLTLLDDEAEEARTPMPDVSGALEWDFGEGRNVRAAGVARWLTYYALDGGSEDTVTGWGVMLNGLWTWKRNGWRASGQVHYGSGIGTYIGDLAGQGLDAVLVAPGRLETVASFGFYGGLEPQWTEWLASTFVYGYLEVLSPPASLPGTTLKRTHYLSGNLKVRPMRSFELGAELLFGRRQNLDGAADHALRLILSTRFFY